MTIKNNDDVAHLLDATGRTGTPYREFEGPSDQMSAPLIDAIFGKAPPDPDRQEMRMGIGSGPSHDLLADVFDSPQSNQAPAIGSSGPADRGGWQTQPVKQHPAAGLRPPASASANLQRSLNDIRRIISQPAGPPATSPSSDNLNGLFERLAG